jgi:hypothetical protein
MIVNDIHSSLNATDVARILTYHRWADRDQVEACYPQFPEFLRLKRLHDPTELFQSEWYRHHTAMFAAEADAA